MRIQWDSVLVAATARALDQRFGGERVRAVHLDPDARRLILWLRSATLVWKLHPEEIGMALLPEAEPPPEARRLPARIHSIHAPADDRVIEIEMRRVRGSPARVGLVLELLTNQENALLLEGDERTIRMLMRTREGDRDLVRGRPWKRPERAPRTGAMAPLALEEWKELLAGSEPGEERRYLMRTLAWTSALLVDALLDVGDPAAQLELWSRVQSAALGKGSGPAAILEGRVGPQPWPILLPDRTIEPADDLLAAFIRLEELGAASTTLLPRVLLDRLRDRVDRLRGRAASLEEELGGLDDPDEVRALGDLLLARFGEIPNGAESVTLEDFGGSTRTVELDPKLRPDENARRYYDGAARIERAEKRLPPLIERARAEWNEAERLLERAEAGDATRAEIEALLPAAPSHSQRSGEDASTLPYRVYRTSTGREIRVGRGAGRNDDLTFRHSAPNDIWLHARHTAGAHVILRWGRDDHPEAKDLYEAGVLAALNSKARTSGSVPVDWTWRKHVRKPRKAPPGAVLPDRVKTVFVEPDESWEERLRDD